MLVTREDETLLQFAESEVYLGDARTSGQSRDDASAPTGSDVPLVARSCPVCLQTFSGDARFCPFDGEPLVVALDWNPSGDPLLGTLIDGRYEVQGVLGEGGMGRVYRVKHESLGRLFAVKALKPELASDAALAARFIQEAKAAASVSSPWVVQITDFGALRTGEPYFVMELLEGESLSQVIHQWGPMSCSATVQIARRIAEGLGAAHDARIIHRDLKPDNIHVAGIESGQPRVKVLDFGLAKVAGGSKLTRDGMVFGTPHYMSPEQAAGEELDHRVDIYSLGVVMFEMVTGRTPFEADTYMGVLTQHIHVVPPKPSSVIGSDSLGPLEDIILKCLAKVPSHRFSSMEELVHELKVLEESFVERRAKSRHGDATVPVPLLERSHPAFFDPGVTGQSTRSISPLSQPIESKGECVSRQRTSARFELPLLSHWLWAFAVGVVLFSSALVYLLAFASDRRTESDQAAVVSSVSLTVGQRPTSPSVSPHGSAHSVERPSPPPVVEAARAPAAPVVRRAGGLPTALSSTSRRPLPVARAKSSSSRRSAAPISVPSPSPSPAVSAPKPKMPSLSGGDIIDPWAQ